MFQKIHFIKLLKNLMNPSHNLDSVERRACAVCGKELQRIVPKWLWRCNFCKFHASDLWNDEVWEKKESKLNEDYRVDAIKKLRYDNARMILTKINSIQALATSHLCDIGTAYGWFLDVVEEFGGKGLGIEPEAAIADAARLRGKEIITGTFPESLGKDVKFEIITLNDVLEHMPDVESCIKACANHLKPGGLLSIVLPSSNGFFYKLGMLLSKLGIEAPLDRLWQKNFHSPHLSYFNDQNLETLLSRNGFHLESKLTLPTVTLKGLWNRVRMDNTNSLALAVLYWCGIVVISPLFRFLPADIIFHIYKLD